MAVRTITTKLALDGEADFRAKIKNINAELTLHKTELERIQAQYKDSANSMEALSAKQTALEGQLEALNQKHQEQASMLEKAKSAYEKYASEVAALEAQQKALQDSTSDSAEEEKKLAEELERAKASMEKAANSVTAYQTQLNRTERDQANLSAELEQTAGYLDEAQSSVDGCATSIDQYGKQVKEAADKAQDLGDKGSSAVNALAQAIAAAGIAAKVQEVTAALHDCVDTFASFEAQMSTVQAISGATAEDMAALTEKAKAMGATTSFTAAEAGRALEYMAMAGWKTEDMLGGLEGIMNLAAASGESLASTSDIVTDALTAFGLAASDSGHFADVLAAASSNANTNVSMMGETFKYAAPVAGALGDSIEDTALAIGLMANAGIKGSSAGTALRTTLTNLSKPTDTVAGYMDDLGISLTDSQGKMRSLSDLMGTLRERFRDLSEAEQAEYAAGIAGKEAMSGLLAIVNASEADYQKLTDAINDCSSAAYNMSQIKLDNYAGKITLLNSAVDGFKVAVGESLTPALGRLAEAGTTAFSWATEFVEENPWVVQAVAGIAGAVGLLAGGLAAYTAAAAAANAVQAALNTTMSLCPIVAVTAAAGALLAVMAGAAAKTAEISEGTKKLTKSLKESKDAYEELTAAMEEENSNVSASVKALEDLLSAEDRSAAQKEQIAKIVDKLNEALPDLDLAYDETTDSINMTTDALERAADAMAADKEYDAQVDRLAELRVEYASLSDQVAETQEKLDTALANAQWDSFGGAANEAANQVTALREDMESLTAAQEACAAETAELEAAVDSYSQQQAEAASPTQEMEERIASLIGQVTELEAAYQESYAEAMESINGQMGLFQEMDGTAKTSVDNLIGTLKGQVAYMETYAENINKAMEMGVDEGLVRKLSDGKEESAQILAAIVEGGEDDIKALNDEFAKVEEGKKALGGTMAEMELDFEKKMEAMVGDLKLAFDEMDVKDEAYEIGLNNIQGLIDGSTSPEKVRELVNAYTELGESAFAAYQRAMDQHSPSKKMFKAGTYDIKGLIQGAESEKGHLKSAYIDLAETGTLGVAEGLSGSSDKVVQAADKLAGEVYSSNKSWLDKQAKYQKLTLREQLEVWEAIQTQFIKESKQYAQAEEQIFDLKAQIQEEYCEKVEEVHKKITELEQSYQDTLASRTQEIFSSYKLFDAVPELEEVSGRDLIGNLQGQIQRLEDFYNGLDDLAARGVGDALVEEIRAMGPSAMSQLDALLNLSDLKLTEYADLYKKKQRLANQQAIDELQPLREETNRQIQEALQEISDTYSQLAPAVGTAFTDAVALGITGGSDTVTAAADALVRKAMEAAEQALSGPVKSVGGISYDPNTDYSALMRAAKDVEEFQALAAQRNAKILAEQIDLTEKGWSGNAELMQQWQSAMAQAEERSQKMLADVSQDISGEIGALVDGAPDMGEDFVNGLIAGINQKAAALNQTVSRMVQDLRACMEAEFQPIQQQIAQSISDWAESSAMTSRAERSNMAQAMSAAMREALSGMSVNMSQRKVGELVTSWQNNNDRGRGV